LEINEYWWPVADTMYWGNASSARPRLPLYQNSIGTAYEGMHRDPDFAVWNVAEFRINVQGVASTFVQVWRPGKKNFTFDPAEAYVFVNRQKDRANGVSSADFYCEDPI